MKKIKCLIVDDEPLAQELMEKYVLRTPFLELKGICSNAYEAIEKLHEEQIDLIFLDIQMPDLSGVEFSRTLSKSPRVIFTTAFEKYALDGFKVDAIDYLLKPFSYEEFLKAANKANNLLNISLNTKDLEKRKTSIYIKSEYKLLRVQLNDIDLIEGYKDYVKIYLTDKIHPILSLLSLKILREELPDDQFMRIHRSYIVNLEKIESVEKGQVVICNNRITVADQYKDDFNSYLSSSSLNF